MKLFWVSAIIYNKGDKEPWLCAMTSPEVSIENAKLIIERLKKNHNVISVWIDESDGNGSVKTIFHECYL